MAAGDWHDDADDFDDEFEAADPPDDDDIYVTCPNCGMQVYDEAPLCPYCNEVLNGPSAHFLDGKPTWYVLLALLGIAAVIVALLM